jgi:DNA repair exonuclease SbcCD ATPase subunit
VTEVDRTFNPNVEVAVEEDRVPVPRVSSVPAAGTAGSLAPTAEERYIVELEGRLRERVRENLTLDSEVRSLHAELGVQREYIASLEREAAETSELRGQLIAAEQNIERLQEDSAELQAVALRLSLAERERDELRAQVATYQGHLSRVLVDHVAVATERVPYLHRMMRFSIARVNTALRKIVRRR